MSIIIQGRETAFLLLITVVGALAYYMWRASIGKIPKLRKLPQIDVIDEIIGRCVEMGSPLWFLPLNGLLKNSYDAPATLASLSILSYVAKRSAELELEIHVPTMLPMAFNIQQEIVKDAYETAGKSELYDPLKTVLFTPGTSASTMYAVSGLWREKVKGCFLVGRGYINTIQLCEAAARSGALTLGGTDTTHNIPFIVAATDYSLIGEELYAMGAYLSQDPVQTACIAGQDIGKLMAIFLMLIGTIAGLVGFNIASWF
jgi:hypothetical protein